MAHDESPGTRMEMSPAAAPDDAPPADARPADARPTSRTTRMSPDATCAIAWRADGYEAIQVFVDPALSDRADGLCAAIEGWSFVHRRLDDLSTEIMQYADREGMSVAIDSRPDDDPSAGLVAIAITSR